MAFDSLAYIVAVAEVASMIRSWSSPDECRCYNVEYSRESVNQPPEPTTQPKVRLVLAARPDARNGRRPQARTGRSRATRRAGRAVRISHSADPTFSPSVIILADLERGRPPRPSPDPASIEGSEARSVSRGILRG
ncbi:hypothetical protein [Haladaptatus halobius]|uniref:hypothetical protein n=1 Tax=Haladaptatus halobius TaxID=2884875 RepID=UPI001D09DF57|nr:hypothetical protein [Haladaptatus halobius]